MAKSNFSAPNYHSCNQPAGLRFILYDKKTIQQNKLIISYYLCLYPLFIHHSQHLTICHCQHLCHLLVPLPFSHHCQQLQPFSSTSTIASTSTIFQYLHHLFAVRNTSAIFQYPVPPPFASTQHVCICQHHHCCQHLCHLLVPLHLSVIAEFSSTSTKASTSAVCQYLCHSSAICLLLPALLDIPSTSVIATPLSWPAPLSLLAPPPFASTATIYLLLPAPLSLPAPPLFPSTSTLATMPASPSITGGSSTCNTAGPIPPALPPVLPSLAPVPSLSSLLSSFLFMYLCSDETVD